MRHNRELPQASELEEGPNQGLPVWSCHVGDPIVKSNLTRRVEFALFMVEALTNDALVHEAPAIVGSQSPSALAYAAATVAPVGAARQGRDSGIELSGRVALVTGVNSGSPGLAEQSGDLVNG